MAPVEPMSCEQAAAAICGMDREQLLHELLSFRAARVRVDFTREYLEKMSLEALRHLLWAAMIRLTPAA